MVYACLRKVQIQGLRRFTHVYARYKFKVYASVYSSAMVYASLRVITSSICS
jgi:hypothetical protein